MGFFGKNIQEMEASGELVKLRKRWFKSPKKCHNVRQSEDPFPVNKFVPLAFVTTSLIAVAIILATINRFCRNCKPWSLVTDLFIALRNRNPENTSTCSKINIRWSEWSEKV